MPPVQDCPPCCWVPGADVFIEEAAEAGNAAMTTEATNHTANGNMSGTNSICG